MPLRRSPPPPKSDQAQGRSTKVLKSKSKAALQPQLEPETAFSNTSEDEDRPSSRTDRAMRRLGGAVDASDIQSAVAEMRVLFANMSSKHEDQFASLQSSIKSFKSDMSDLAGSIEYLTQKYEAFQDQVGKLESERADNLRQIRVLESKVESLERKSRSSCVELRNVPKLNQSEGKTHLCSVISSLGSALDINIQEQDISDIYRVTTKSESTNPIVVEFVSSLKKETLMMSIRKFNKGKKKEDKLNTRHAKIEGAPRPMFVSESLTQKAKHLFYLARDFAKTQGYAYCWSSNGNIYLRKKENMPFVRVVHEADLEKLKEKE